MDKESIVTPKYTHEDLIGKFDSSFELVNYAIHRVRNYIYSGRHPLIDTDVHNPAYIILEVISCGKDHLDSIEEGEEESMDNY